MGQNIIWCALALLLCSEATPSPRTTATTFARSAVETVLDHEPIPLPIRSSVESIPSRSLRDEFETRLPLRDAVEKRPIPVFDLKQYYKLKEDAESIPNIESLSDLRSYYGAASYLNNGTLNDERLHQGNVNLQEMQQTSANNPSNRRLVICYMESWASYRAPPLAFTAGLVPKSCTHLHYTYATLHPHTYKIIPTNEDYDIIKGGYRIATGLKRRMPGLKVILSVGGDGSQRLFSEMVQETRRRSLFINSAAKFLQEHDFDGMELNWVYAGDKDEKEKELLTSLLYELRENLSAYGLILSTVLPPFRYLIDDGYDLSAVSGASDYAVLQAWDMTHGKKDEPPSRALQHSALHVDPGAASRDQRYDNIEFIVKYITRRGMVAEKLVLGVPLYGRSYTLAPSALPVPGAVVTGWGDEGSYTQTKGSLAYFEICMNEREGKFKTNIDEAGNSYAVNENQWVAYDTPNTILEKMKFVVSSGLAGAAAWAIDMDDFRGLCGSPFPILNAISSTLNGESQDKDQSSLKVSSCESEKPYLSSDPQSCAHFHFCDGKKNFRLLCESDGLYDPSTGYCGHQDVTKCIPGQSLRISVEQAIRYLNRAHGIKHEEEEIQATKYLLGPQQTIGQSERIVASQIIKQISEVREQMSSWTEANSPDYNFITAARNALSSFYRTINKSFFRTNTILMDFTRMSRIDRNNNKKVVCYMTSWAFYRRGDGKFVPEHVDTRLCTHLIYAYASLSPDELIAKEFDPWTDINNNLYERVTSLQDVKVMLGLGGWTDSAGDKYSKLISSASLRSKFITKLIPFLRMHNFKGLHLDWNYPVCWQSNCKKGPLSDKANYATFIEELSRSLHSAGMELGVAVSGYKEVIETAYVLPAISKAVDFMSSMTYDYHGGWERSTGHHTPLTPKSPSDPLAYYSIEYAIKALIEGGADPKKLLLGLAFYGQSYRLADSQSGSGPGAPAAGPGEPGEFTKQPGMLAYYEICYRVKNLRWKTGKQDRAGPYAYSDNQWVGYDDPKSITEKVEWALKQGLGGVTAWAIDLDDFNNRCCAEPFPLLKAAGRALGRAVASPPTSPCERPPPPVTPPPPTTTTVASDGASTPSGVTGSHDHDHHHHQQPASTTSWPSWNPPATTQSTAMTWWPQSTTQSTTTTTSTTTMKPIVVEDDDVSGSSGGLEGTSCNAGEYHNAPDDCGGYLQCEGGVWRKHQCAPGLHWSSSTNRCDWPLAAKCQGKPPSAASTATTTLAPMTSRPPRPVTRPSSTTTTTTTTTTTRKPIIAASPPSTGMEGKPCNGADYMQVPGDCNSYLHCNGVVFQIRRCAPGLHWSQSMKHCDWPKYSNCKETQTKPSSTTASPWQTTKTTTASPWQTSTSSWQTSAKPQRPIRPITTTASSVGYAEGSSCSDNDLHAPGSTCETYLLCVGGKWRKQQCPLSLHWDKRTKRCDWAEFAMCDLNMKTTKAPTYPMMTTRKPYTTTTRKTVTAAMQPTKPTTPCQTGTYHTHPRCEKFYICVNGELITQSCAPGLIWRPDRNQCDFPTANACNDRRQVSQAMIDATKPAAVVEQISSYCESGQYSAFPNDCSRYRHCLFGKFEQFTCSAGLHWNQDKKICDWPQNAQCKEQKATTPKPIEMDIEVSKPVQTAPSYKPTTGTEPNLPSSRPGLLNTKYKLVCYYTNWSWYRPGIGKFSPEDIDPSLCTHIVYGFAVLGDDGLITAHDTWADYDNQLYEKVVQYKRYGIKVSLALGGWNDSAGDKYSKLVNDPWARARFVKHAMNFLDRFGFDGLDLDWEYPKCWQVDCSKGPNSDKEAFADLVRELSAVLKPKGLLLSAAVSPSKKVIDEGYNVPVLAKHLDWIAVMTYDYHGQWDQKTGHVAPLFYHPDDDNTYFNANYTMHYWMEKGAPASKLVMGMPMYGQTFTTGVRFGNSLNFIGKSQATGLNTPAISGGEAGEYTRAKGFLSYYEICERIRHQGWKMVQDPYRTMGPYAYKDNQWVSFDDVETIKRKTEFIKSLGLAGGMIWALDLDDFKNRCGQGKHPLINAIKQGLMNPNIDYNAIYPVDIPRPTEPILPSPISEPANDLDDLEDIEVKPSFPKPPRPTRPPVQNDFEIITTKPSTTTMIATAEERYRVVCYYTNWAWYRPESGKYTPNDIDPSLCTHIVYAFAVLDNNKLVIKSHDNWLDIENKFYEKVVALKSHGVKVLLGLGGWNDSSGDKYSRLVSNPSARRKFIVHAIDFLDEFGFDGLDLDWEYPKCWQVECDKGPSSDKQNFANLVQELRSSFDRKGLLLSAAVSASKRVIDMAYDVPVLSQNLDWISLMTYDYHGQWDKKTGHVAPMYASDEDSDKTLNTNFTVHYWINQGADREKLVLGVPFYGQSFALMENSGTGLGAESYAGGEGGDETRARGFLSFYEICERIRMKGWKVERDAGGRMGPYAFKKDQWVSFDDDFMVRHKAEYVKAMGLGGNMVWSLDLDDFDGRYCGCGKSPLLRTINSVFKNTEPPPVCPLEELQGSETESFVMQPTESAMMEPEPESPVAPQEIFHDTESGISMEGKACSGVLFRADDTDCKKYYLCINDQYVSLRCPDPLYWNKNHCDWPERSSCKSKAQFRITGPGMQEASIVKDKPIIACYFTNWAYYRHGIGKFSPDQVNPSMCTHIIYAWAHLDNKTFELVPGLPELDVDNDFYGKIAQFRSKGIKVIIGAGGLEDSEGDKWSKMIAYPETRAAFIQSVFKFLKRWKFDGIQIAWQYPVCKQVPCTTQSSDSAERDNFSHLLDELSSVLNPHNYELSLKVAAIPEIADLAYYPNVITDEVDWVAIAANDLYASTSGKTTYLMPLEDTDDRRNSFNSSLVYWVKKIGTNKLVLTVPAYARSYTLVDKANTDIGAPIVGPGEPGPHTKVPGFLAYYEVCTDLKSPSWKEFSEEFGTFAVKDTQWSSYLRPSEVHRVGASAARGGLRGVGLWALDLDDWSQRCACTPQPLLTALRQGFMDPAEPLTLCP